MVEIYGPKDLSEAVRSLRKKAHLSQGQLAELAGLSRTAIQSIESGKESCQLDTAFKVMKVLNIHVHLNHPLLNEGQNL